MKKKEKKHIAPNEASLGRWLGVLLVGMPIFSNVLAFPIFFLLDGRTGSFLGVGYAQITEMLNFACIFAGLVVAIKLVGKTSLKEFILGVGNSFNKKECLTILGLSVVGFGFSLLTDLGNIHLRGVNAGDFAGLVLITLLLVWMQTTLEELIFRGFVLRWICKNDIGFNKKTILAAVISAVLFAVAHVANPEVTTLSGMERFVMVFVYVIPGITYFFMDLYFGNLMPGIIMHWANNFLLFTLVSGEVSVLTMPTLLVLNSSHNPYAMLISSLLSKLPFVAYILWDIQKKKKAASVG